MQGIPTNFFLLSQLDSKEPSSKIWIWPLRILLLLLFTKNLFQIKKNPKQQHTKQQAKTDEYLVSIIQAICCTSARYVL